jgi:phage major head subunit gpT-like protein/phage head maturation protease
MTTLTRAATFAPTTLDRSGRTVEVVALSGYAPVHRSSGSPAGNGPWIEELDADGADLTAFAGAPVLRDHRPTTDNHVGAVEEPKRESGTAGNRLSARVRFSAKPAAEEVLADVEGGILRGVSLGYRVAPDGWRNMGARNGLPVYRAVKWTPRELSFTPLPADAGATVRTDEDTMSDTTAAPADQAHNEDQTRAAPANGNVNRAEINQEIRSIAAVAGLDQAWTDAQIDAGATVDQARAAAFEAMRTRSGGDIRTERPTVQMGHSYDDPNTVRTAMAHALAARLAPHLVKPEGQATQFMGYRTLDCAGELAIRRGDRLNRFDQHALLERAVGAHSTSDFPLLLADAANKILLAQYNMAPPTYRRWAAKRGFNDFKAHKFLRVGDFPSHQEVAESGELTFSTLSENREQITAKEYARGIIIGRRALINDDMGALSGFATMAAVRAAADENNLVYSVIASNGPTLSDSVAMFNSAHGNKAASGTDIDVTNVAAARAAMRKQTSLDGLKLNITGSILLCGPDKELKARQLVAQITAAKASDVNPWSGTLDVLVDAEITGNRWYIVADPMMVPTVVYGYVNGAEGPQILTERDFNTQGIKVRSGFDFGAGAIDFRGMYLNEGA